MSDIPFKAKEFILNAIYHKKHILKIFDLAPSQYKHCINMGWFQASVRQSRESGQTNLYSFDDLLKIFHFQLLRDVDIKTKLAVKIINHKNANDYPFGICIVYGDKDSPDLISGNIKFYPLAAADSLCSTIFRSVILDKLEQRE